jgi:hypothetical protein
VPNSGIRKAPPSINRGRFVAREHPPCPRADELAQPGGAEIVSKALARRSRLAVDEQALRAVVPPLRDGHRDAVPTDEVVQHRTIEQLDESV